MKKQLKETLIFSTRGPAKVITHGYNTQINGLDVIMTINDDQSYVIVHTKSGLSLGVWFGAPTKAVKFANKYLKDFDFSQNADDLTKDGKLGKCVYNAKKKRGDISGT